MCLESLHHDHALDDVIAVLSVTRHPQQWLMVCIPICTRFEQVSFVM